MAKGASLSRVATNVPAERGQASVELLAALPFVLVAGLLCLQLLAAGYSLTLADGAAEAGALALASDLPPEPAVEAALPGLGARPGRARAHGRPGDRQPAPPVAAGRGRPRARGQLLGLGPQAGDRRGRGMALSSPASCPAPAAASPLRRRSRSRSPPTTPRRAVLLVEVATRRGRGPTMLAAARRGSSSTSCAPRASSARRAGGSRGSRSRSGRAGWGRFGTSRRSLAAPGRSSPCCPPGRSARRSPANGWWSTPSSCGPSCPASDRSPRWRSPSCAPPGLRARVAARSPGRVGGRRALAGIDPGGEASRRAARLARGLLGRSAPRGTFARGRGRLAAEAGQALPLVLGGVLALLFATLLLAAFGGAVTGKSRAQRAADLAALSAARSMRDDFDRLFVAARGPTARPTRLTWPSASTSSAPRPPAPRPRARNGVGAGRVGIEFPDAASFAPLRVRAEIAAELDTPGGLPRASRRGARRGRGRAGADPGRRGPPGFATRRRLLRAARVSAGGGHAARRRGRLRPDGRRGERRRGRAADQRRLSLRRRAGGALGTEPGPALGRAAGHLAAPLRDRARPRPARRLRLAGRQRRPLRLPPALLVGGLALRLHRRARALLGRRRRGRVRRRFRGTGHRGGTRRRRRRGQPAVVRARALSRRDRRRGAALERLRSAARRPADGRVELQPVRRQPGRRRRDRPVHARDRGRLRPRRPVRPRGGDRRSGAPDVRPAGAVRRHRARARRLQRRRRRGRSVRLRARLPRDPGLRRPHPRPDRRRRRDRHRRRSRCGW